MHLGLLIIIYKSVSDLNLRKFRMKLEDGELSTIEDTIADAIGTDNTDDGDQIAWGRVMQMIRLSEGIVSEKMFARQLRRKFL